MEKYSKMTFKCQNFLERRARWKLFGISIKNMDKSTQKKWKWRFQNFKKWGNQRCQNRVIWYFSNLDGQFFRLFELWVQLFYIVSDRWDHLDSIWKKLFFKNVWGAWALALKFENIWKMTNFWEKNGTVPTLLSKTKDVVISIDP